MRKEGMMGKEDGVDKEIRKECVRKGEKKGKRERE